jgi:hypothetical protein
VGQAHGAVGARIGVFEEERGRVCPALARLEERRDVVDDRGARLAGGRLAERVAEPAFHRAGERRLERREAHLHRVAVDDDADELAGILRRGRVGPEEAVRREVGAPAASIRRARPPQPRARRASRVGARAGRAAPTTTG